MSIHEAFLSCSVHKPNQASSVPGRFGLNKEFSALEGAVPGSAESAGSYCQTLVRCCEEVWRRMSSPAATVFGLPRSLQAKGDASFKRWRVCSHSLFSPFES
jgi:hypothetical protein